MVALLVLTIAAAWGFSVGPLLIGWLIAAIFRRISKRP